MTTTGGPGHSVTEPAIVEHLDGDDIVVVPDEPPAHHRRSRGLLVGVVVAAVIAAGIGIAVAVTRDDEKPSAEASAPVRTTPTPAPSQPRSVKPKQPAKPVTQPPVAVAPETPVSSPPVAVPPPPPVAPQVPPDTTPAASPPSVLQWSSTPAALTIPAGGHKTLTVHVVNPSDGTVTLGHPLSCPPTLHDAKGHAIGYGVCVEMAQLMAPHDELNQRYVIYTTDTAAAGGEALEPGTYTASVENLFDIKVTVTA